MWFHRTKGSPQRVVIFRELEFSSSEDIFINWSLATFVANSEHYVKEIFFMIDSYWIFDFMGGSYE